jgi:hypothetical protein
MKTNQYQPSRRQMIQTSAALGTLAAPALLQAAQSGASLKIATFRFDVTPPVGHPLCGGWITPVKDVEDSLEAIGFVLLGAGKPIVICSVDWTGILNTGHVAWRKGFAEAAGNTPDRVAIQCVHQHDAPFACIDAERIIAAQKDGLTVVQPEFFHNCIKRGSDVIKAAVAKARPLTHIAQGEGKVEKVAGNRRVAIGANGKITKMRGSSCKDPELIALPEGLIDPMLKTVAFYDGSEKVLACHYYACHPMSHYGQGHVSSDYPGLARKQRQKDEPGCTHIYFTGAAGNIGAGKYNDGSPKARVELTERIYNAMVASEKNLKPKPITSATWKTFDLVPQVNPAFTRDGEKALVENKKNQAANRIRPAMRLAFMDRIGNRTPIVLSALHLNDVSMIHLPAESFVEYQLRAQQVGKGRFVATAAYGDGGPWYIPVKEEFPKGGYEVSVANCAVEMDDQLSEGIREILKVG